MKRWRTVAVLGALAAIAAAPRDELWKKVEEAQQKGLPKTAIEQLEPIIQQAMAEKAWAEAIKAIGRKIALEGNIQGNKPEEKIIRLQAEIEKAPPVMKPMMEAILANWYWHYFQQNRWRFMQRTQTAEPPGKDFTTWDLPRILAEIGRHYEAALAAEQELKATPVAQYDALLTKGTLPDTYRPTMFDFAAHEALQFYTAGEQAGSKAEDAFEVETSSPALGTMEEFLAWRPDTADEAAATVKAIALYQKLLTFHRGDTDKTAMLDADLLRLNFGYAKAVGEGKAERYKTALKRLATEWADHEVSARVRYHWATVLQEEGALVDARAVAKQGADAFPQSMGGRQCHNLVLQIEAKQVSVATERVWNEPWPTINLSYKNVTKAHFRAVPWDFEERLRARTWNLEYLDDNERKSLAGRRAVLEWSADLPATTNYDVRVEAVPAPKDLKPGHYFILVSHDPSFGEKQNMVSYASVWVSDLALVVRTRQNQGVVEGFVLKAQGGEPVSNATVKAWQQQDRSFSFYEKTTTDGNGLFRFAGVPNRTLVFMAESGGHSLASQGYWSNVHDDQPRPFGQTVFFTDRSLYRPGQTIQYKGLCINVDQWNDNYQTVAGQAVTVVFTDVNNKEVARQSHKANAYGTFSGSFTAPHGTLTGRMQIRVAESHAPGSAWVNVEEYKRPKFQVALEAPKDAAKLNGEVVLKGKATAYTGVAIGDAKVKWRVTRGVQYPVWWRWAYWWWAPRSDVQEIAHGTARTASDGTFTVRFIAKPDLAVAETDEPTFTFTAYSDVTDTTGETRSAQRGVNVGYTALSASLSAAEWLETGKPAELAVRTATLDGVGQAAEGTVKVYALKQPERPARPAIMTEPSWNWSRRRAGKAAAYGGARSAPKPDASNPNSWELGELAGEQPFKTDATGGQKLKFDLKAGIYRAMLDTRDRFGKPVTARLPVQVMELRGKRLGVAIPNHVAAPKWNVEPGESFVAVWGTGYDRGRAFVEVEHRRKVLKAFWTAADATQEMLEQSVDEAMRGGFTVRWTYVRENRAYLTQRQVAVPWSNKRLDVKWERFVSKLEPAQKETWTAIVTGPDAKRAAAEMVAGLYDASLDAYLAHHWMAGFSVFRNDWSNLNSSFENRAQGFQHLHGYWPSDYRSVDFTYRDFPGEIVANLWGYGYFGGRGKGALRGHGGMDRAEFAAGAPAAPAMMARAVAKAAPADGEMDGLNANGVMLTAMAEESGKDKAGVNRRERKRIGGAAEAEAEEPTPDLSQVTARKNLNETAFFYPHLTADSNGVVKIEFTMPEALTEWKFMGFAHDGSLRAGFLSDKAVTAKDLMVEPNAPRFVREGDAIEFTVKVSNRSAAGQTGSVRLTLADARTLKSVDAELGNKTADLKFEVPAGESRAFSWRLTVPDGMGFLTYKAVASTGRLSDGEEGYLPVLSRRILVTESLPLPVRGAQTKKFEFGKLAASGKSDTLRHQSLTVQMVSQPAWYAVMALPYLMEYPHECTEQTFNRLYANSLAKHIADADPKIRRVFDQWKGTPALDSPMEKNQDLKAVVLEETPWLRQARDESQARRNVGILFDENRLNAETVALYKRMADLQLGSGLWPWFPGGRGSEYITLYITTGYGRLRHLGVKGVDMACAVKSLNALDGWINEIYREILRHGHKDENHLTPTIALYLYGRSFFLQDRAIGGGAKEAVDYFLGQTRKHWLRLENRQSQGHLAVAMKRFGDLETAKGIMASIKERSVTDEELGRFWRDTELSWWWYRAPIETQAMMIEAFDEVMADAVAVDECRVWLLKQKQTQDWKTTKATADAIYGLLLRGANWLASDALVEVALGGETIKPEKVEAGTGFYEKRFVGPEVSPKMGHVTVKKVDEGVSWGSVHWQYLEDMTKVTPYEGTPLKLKKSLFVKENTGKGPVLKPVKGSLAVGDELVVRVELRTDRDMEYVHLKDQRGCGTEPVNVLSQYRYQDGLAYYESTKDTASHFFIDYLPKGVYVFEYSVRVQHKGRYQSGMAEVQCMYAPEFNSHSESFGLVVE